VNLEVASLTILETLTLWCEGEGRWMDAEITEVAFIGSRGGRVGMYSQIYSPVLETRHGGGEATDLCV
jgi:hypothetical protein